MSSDSILKVQNVNKSFGGVNALKNVNIEIKKGEIHCLAGGNGGGKSTLIKIVSGFYTKDSGVVEIDGHVYDKLNPQKSIEAGVQVIYQDFSLFPNLTVLENLSYSYELANKQKFVNKKRMREIAVRALDTIKVDMDLDALVSDLSVANKQLIAISRALLNNAKLIIMDEPTTALTKHEVKILFDIIKDLQSKGISILFVSHKLDEVFEISERYTILRNGTNVATGATSDLTQKDFTYYMTGRDFGEAEEKVDFSTDKVALRVENLCLNHGFKDINLHVKQGEVVGLVGLLGSGRTELAETIFGYRKKDSGRVYVNGEKVEINNINDALKHGIGYVPEDRLTQGLFLEQSIMNNVSLLKWEEFSKKGFVNSDLVDEEVKKWIEKIDIVASDENALINTLSGGNQQKCLLARWLAYDLNVLILNGPTVGVDIGAKFDIHKIIRHLAQENKLAILMISDDEQEAIENCDRLLVMKEGHIVAEVEGEQVKDCRLSELIGV